jgi:hypothetical protein
MAVKLRPVVVLVTLAASAGPLLAGAGATPPSDVVFQPHRAVYDLKLDRTAPGGSVSNVTGRVVYELIGSACEGYAQNMRFVTETTNSEGEGDVSDLRTSSWEDVPAKRLRFNSTTYSNDNLTDQTQGVASRGADRSAPVSVAVSKPAKKTAELKGSIYFPIEHSMELIRLARKKQPIFTADLYDGSEGGEKVYLTTSVIGNQLRPEAVTQLAKLKNGDKLVGVPSSPVAISYFKPSTKQSDDVPLYEMSYRFHENGITSQLKIDHGEFALFGELTELVLLEASPCPGDKK